MTLKSFMYIFSLDIVTTLPDIDGVTVQIRSYVMEISHAGQNG